MRRFFNTLDAPIYLSSITIGELQRGVNLCRYRGDIAQADALHTWLTTLVSDLSDHIQRRVANTGAQLLNPFD